MKHDSRKVKSELKQRYHSALSSSSPDSSFVSNLNSSPSHITTSTESAQDRVYRKWERIIKSGFVEIVDLNPIATKMIP